jgi:hypothetical protein
MENSERKQPSAGQGYAMTLGTFTPKPKTCVQCGSSFLPFKPIQAVCGPVCALKLVRAAREREKAHTQARKAAIKPRAKWLAECQAIVNKYVRLRDKHLGCVSCDRPASWDGQWHASHLRSVGAASAIRFHLWNIHKACSICNNYLSGNLASYRPMLVERIGAEKVDWLYEQNQTVKHEIEYLKRFKAVMGKRLRRMERRL